MDSAATTSSTATSTSTGKPLTFNFETFKKVKESERRLRFEPKSKAKEVCDRKKAVFINVGLMELQSAEYRRVFGRTLPV